MADEDPRGVVRNGAVNLAPDAGNIILTISHCKNKYSLSFPDDATVTDLMKEVEARLDIPIRNQKLIVPKRPLLKAPLPDPNMPLSELRNKAIILMGSTAAQVEAVQNLADKVARRDATRKAQIAHAKTAPKQTQARTTNDIKYTFLQVRPLHWLPRPERSQKILMRLKEDPGVRATMRKHKFIVSMLTEMEPLAHTQSDNQGTSRTLGLNRNQGEVIELRLRTDAYDGYRDYKTIRKTLCHELAHNVHGPHDRNFWDLCHQIEREVEAADWKTGGHTIGETSRYTITGQDDDGDEDDGGWTGGEFVLGGVRDRNDPGMSRRETLAQAALERQRREAGEERESCDAAEKGWRPCQRPNRNDGENKR